MSGEALEDGLAGVIASALWLLLPVLFTGLASVILTRQPDNGISWLLYSVGLGVLLDIAVQPHVEAPPSSPVFWDYVAIFLSNTMWLAIFFPLFLLLFVFPTGHFMNHRWRWARWPAIFMPATVVFFSLFSEEVGPPNDSWLIANPIGLIPNSGIWEGFFGVLWSLSLLSLALGGLVAMVVRFRRSTVVVRTQIKWVLYAAFVFALGYGASVIASVWTIEDDSFFWILFVLSLALLPVSITAAITRYRLFEIDRIISRTLSYALVAGLLATVYLVTVTAVTSLLPTQNALAVAGSTLAVAALFNPLRKRIQHGVDRRFNRSAYQAEVVSEGFATKLRESLTTEELVEAWSQAVNESFQPELTGIWLNKNLTTTPKPDRP